MDEKNEIELTEGYHDLGPRDIRLLIHEDADPGSSKPLSSCIKVQTVTKFNWPKHYYHGSLISVSTKFIAYVIRGKSDAVRVLNRHTATRVLLKGFNASVSDISFAHTNSTFFGAIDEAGTTIIFTIDQKKDGIQSSILLKVERDVPLKSPYHRLVWSPKIGRSEDFEDDIRGLFVATTLDLVVEVWKLSSIVESGKQAEFTSSELSNPNVLNNGYLTFEAHEDIVTDVSLAPDGNVMCTSSLDGLVKFWDTSMLANNDKITDKTAAPPTLHTWYPHDKKPISSIKFLDNHLESCSDVPFWRFLLTGAEMNNELKIWCTVKWVCLQTLTFTSLQKPFPEMKISTDQSGNYILVTDIHRRVIYCLECFSSFENGGSCYIRSTTVCLLDTPVLSFLISTVKAVTMMSSEEPPKRRRGVQIQCFTLHQANLYKLQTRILHSDSFLLEVANSGSGTPSGFLSPVRALSPSQLSGEEIYNSKSRLNSDTEIEARAQARAQRRAKTPIRNTKSSRKPELVRKELPPEPNLKDSNQVRHTTELYTPVNVQLINHPATNEQKDMTSIIEKLKNNRRSSNSSSVSTTSVTGAIEMTSGPTEDQSYRIKSPEKEERSITMKIEPEAVCIPVNFRDDDSESVKSSTNQSGNSDTYDQAKDISPTISPPESSNAPSLLQSIFSSVKNKGVQSLSLAGDSTLTEITPVSEDKSDVACSDTQVTETEKTAAVNIDAMSMLFNNLKKKTEEKQQDASQKEPTPHLPDQLASIIGQRPEAPGVINGARVLIFGDEIINQLDQVFIDNSYSVEVHMLEGAETKNIQKYIQESIGVRKEAELCIFHVGTNDISARRTEAQYNTDLMLLFGACRSSFPNARLCCSSVLPRHDEFASKVVKFNQEADQICEVSAVEFLNNTKVLADIDNYMYNQNPSECVKLTNQGRSNLGMHFLCFIEDSLNPGTTQTLPKMVIGPKLEKKLPKEGYEVRNLTPVTEDKDEIPDEPRHIGDGSKEKLERDGTGDGSQSPLPPTLNQISPSSSQPTFKPITPSTSSTAVASAAEIRDLISLIRRQTDEIEKMKIEVRNLKNNNGSAEIKSIEKLAQEVKNLKLQLSKQNERQNISNGYGDAKFPVQLAESVINQATTRLSETIERTLQSKLAAHNSQTKAQLERTLGSSWMSATISKSIEQSMQDVHKTAMEVDVVPKFEKATREMFRQISDTFSSGTEDYIKRLEDSLERRVRAETSSLEAAISKTEDPNNSMATTLTEKISKSVQVYLQNEIKKIQIMQQNNQLQMNQFFGQMRQLLNSDVEKLLHKHRNELDMKVEDAIARAQTPAPVLTQEDTNLRDQLKRLVDRGNYNEAFTKALMASDLLVVVDLMEMVDQQKIFNPELPSGTALEQNIILSLIQQLSVDLKTKAEIKHTFLQDAILNLDLCHPSAEHIPSVLGQLNSKIQEFVQMWPRDAMAKNYKIIMLTANSRIQQTSSGMKHEFTNHAFN